MSAICAYGDTNDRKEIFIHDGFDQDFDIPDKYAIIIIESGTLVLSDNIKKLSFTGPCVACLKENASMNFFHPVNYSAKRLYLTFVF